MTSHLVNHHIDHISSLALSKSLNRPHPFILPSAHRRRCFNCRSSHHSPGHHRLSRNHLHANKVSRQQHCCCQHDSSSSHPNLPHIFDRPDPEIAESTIGKAKRSVVMAKMCLFFECQCNSLNHVHSTDAASCNQTAAPPNQASPTHFDRVGNE